MPRLEKNCLTRAAKNKEDLYRLMLENILKETPILQSICIQEIKQSQTILNYVEN